mgnify:CR=1 FL=1
MKKKNFFQVFKKKQSASFIVSFSFFFSIRVVWIKSNKKWMKASTKTKRVSINHSSLIVHIRFKFAHFLFVFAKKEFKKLVEVSLKLIAFIANFKNETRIEILRKYHGIEFLSDFEIQSATFQVYFSLFDWATAVILIYLKNWANVFFFKFVLFLYHAVSFGSWKPFLVKTKQGGKPKANSESVSQWSLLFSFFFFLMKKVFFLSGLNFFVWKEKKIKKIKKKKKKSKTTFELLLFFYKEWEFEFRVHKK